MIEYQDGNLCASSAEALVNTVNCKGVMGAGLAKQFKKSFPKNFKYYKKECDSGNLRTGKLLRFTESGKIIINFPTKDDWRNNSKYSYISDGLDALVKVIQEDAIKSIAVPPLGCGKGKLDWAQVREMIEEKLCPVADQCQIYIYGEPSAEYLNRKEAQKVWQKQELVTYLISQLVSKYELRIASAGFIVNCLLENPVFNPKYSRLVFQDSKPFCFQGF